MCGLLLPHHSGFSLSGGSSANASNTNVPGILAVLFEREYGGHREKKWGEQGGNCVCMVFTCDVLQRCKNNEINTGSFLAKRIANVSF